MCYEFKLTKVKKIGLILLSTVCALNLGAQKPIYQDTAQPIEKRVEDALARMTLEEKIRLIHANEIYSFWGVPRLGIPENHPTDGPLGLRPEMKWNAPVHEGISGDSCTSYPALVCLAATWNPEMGRLYGKSYSEEALYRNKNIILGPGVNICRTPLNGRSFEYMGEDPYLTSQMAVSYIQGVQGNHVAACVKHFAVNNQETNRADINTIVDERTLHEIYLPAFKAAVQEGNVWMVMGAYNKYNGQHCCHNQYLLNDILRKEWNYDGVLASDFGGTHDTKEAIFNGLDLEFGTAIDSIESYDNYFLAFPYLELIKKWEVGVKELDEKVRRVLRMMYRTNMSADKPWGSLASPEHADDARKIAEEGIVLLQNKDNILPLDISRLKRVVVVGENAVTKMSCGGGSSEVKAKYEVLPLDGIRNRLGNKVEIIYKPGYSSAVEPEENEKLRMEAVEAAKLADMVIFVGGLNKQPDQDGESWDRKSYELPYNQNELIEELAAVNSQLVAVMISGNAYAMPRVKKVPGIVQAWYAGTESGNVIASVLVGDVNPSGKLPITFPVSLKDNGAHVLNAYPGEGKKVEYKEGIYVGYRWIEKQKIKPLFAFGHGLSYTTFKYGNATVNKKNMHDVEGLVVTVPVTNVGTREGAEIVQLYVCDDKSSLPRPVKELKRFSKVRLAAGETCNVSFSIDKDALSFYDPELHRWVAEPGKFQFLIGSASDDIRTKVSFELE